MKIVVRELGSKKHLIAPSDLIKIMSVVKQDPFVCEMLYGLLGDPVRFKEAALQLIVSAA